MTLDFLQLAKYLGVSPTWLRREFDTNELPHTMRNEKVRFTDRDRDEIMEMFYVGPADKRPPYVPRHFDPDELARARRALAVDWRAYSSARWPPRKTLPEAIRRTIWESFYGLCARCGAFCPERAAAGARRRSWQVDHIVAVADGGTDEKENLQLLCVPCHKEKTSTEATARAAIRKAKLSVVAC